MAMEVEGNEDVVTPGEILGDSTELIAGRGAYLAPNGRNIHASLTGRRTIVPPQPDSADKRATVEVVGHKSHGAVPEPGSVVIARVTKVMGRMASADIMCVGSKSVKEKFTGTISFLLEMQGRITFPLQGMNLELCLLKALQVLPWCRSAGQRCNAH